ncbi:MAG: hypothetical protein AB1633_08030 [Elusimicrobiota bacterium]
MTVKKTKLLISILLISIFSIGCASRRAAFKPGFDIKKIRTIGLGKFGDFGSYPGSGGAVRDEFTRQLIRAGFNISEEDKGVDVILSATLTQYIPEKRYLFYSPKTEEGKQTIKIIPPLEIGGTGVYSLGSSIGPGGEEGRILVSNAVAGISARLLDPVTNEVIWTDSYTYEGFDIRGSIEICVNFLLKPLILGE